MLIVAGHVVIAADRRDALLAEAAPLMAAIRAEDGCVAYSLSADPVHADRVLNLEIWASTDRLRVHLEHANHARMGQLVASFRPRGGDIRKYRVDAVAPMLAPDGTPSLEFPAHD